MKKRDSFIFYRSFYESILELPEESQKDVLLAIANYSLNFKEPELTGLSRAIFILIKPQLDANNKRFENGSKGGRPKGRNKPNNNQNETKAEPNKNVNVNKNDNYKRANIESSGSWIEGVAMHVKLPLLTTTKLLKAFLDEQELKGYEANEKDCKNYFINWLKLNKPKSNIPFFEDPVN